MVPVPEWARWALGGTALAVATGGMLTVLMGPVARRLAGESTPLSAEERKGLTATERIEAVNNARHTLLQAATGLVVIGGLVFTGAGLLYTSRTLEVSQEGQITDRYIRAAEQLGSGKQDVRLAGIYALQRLAIDSPRDRDTIRNVLSAFVRSHDTCTPADGKKALPKQCTTTAASRKALRDIPGVRAGADVLAALTIAPTLVTRNANGDITSPLDFSQVRFPKTDLRGPDLRGPDLRGAYLGGANLRGAYLLDARLDSTYLGGADLRGAWLEGARLEGARLEGARLKDAELKGADLRSTWLVGAYLRGAYLRGADLRAATFSGATLRGADLQGADLRGADLQGADLRGTYLQGADLREIRGMTEQEVRKSAEVDQATKFD
ncbi:hypothetical protein Misp01_44950 [Microtetraspora sp. NBRC 13810]|nr:hypothetical protein Misp01_44950 [Microtetraspora sp. NBRC 13810]